ncbi:unnamed protein product [Pedinophyceae sp. YPF-701]|nr:unnamed protein product [Pedinophyceae sp. YPF-701]
MLARPVVGSRAAVSAGCAARRPAARPAGLSRRIVARAEEEGSPGPSAPVKGEEEKEKAKPASEEPVWVRREKEAAAAKERGDLPFGLYLIASSLVAIAAIGSIFEYQAKNPIFGVVQPDSPLWAPILLFFAVTGIPSSAFLFYKCISVANADAERMDQMDGY